MSETSPFVQDAPMTKSEFKNVTLQPAQGNGGLRLNLNSFADLEKFAHFMAISRFVPKHLRGNQADCLAVLLQSIRWEMDPFSVASMSYFVNDAMAYSSQLVSSVILSRAPLDGRPNICWEGEGESLQCTVSGKFRGDADVKVREVKIKTITTRNSPLWKQDPQQQIAYFTLRAWARLYCPDILMGVYTKEEMEEAAKFQGADNAKDVTPPKPDMSVIDGINAAISGDTVDQTTGEVIEPAAQATSDFELTAETGIREDLIVYPDTDSSGVTDWQKWANDAGVVINALNSEADLDAFRTANEIYGRAIMKEAPTISRANDAVYVARRKALKAA